MKKIMLVFGTRPEAIKMAPLVKEFQKRPNEFQTIVSTARCWTRSCISSKSLRTMT